MNIENVNKVIAIMERAKAAESLYMPRWQSNSHGDNAEMIAKTEDSLHTCGNKACLAGHIAVSPEFREDGGTCGESGSPFYNGYSLEIAISKWLEIDYYITGGLIYGAGMGDVHRLYGKLWSEVTANDVIRVLKELLTHGEEFLLAKLRG